MKTKGVLPLVVMGTPEFDVTSILPETIQLAGDVSALRWSFEDVGGQGDCEDPNPDGVMDLVLHFDVQELVQALGSLNDGDLIAVPVTGEFQA